MADAGPEAFFCAYDCSKSARKNRPGNCFNAQRVFDTKNAGWVLIRTRDETMLPSDRYVLPDWTSLITGNMTWEGWFRLRALPSQPTSLFGTAGPLHDTFAGPVVYDASATSRRRFATVSVDRAGDLEFTTNVGKSSGISFGRKSIADGQWHHVAAVFATEGGAQIEIFVRIKWVMTNTIINRFLEPVAQGLKEALARVAGSGAKVEDISITLSDALFKPTPVFWEYALGVTCLMNTPLDAVESRIAELKAAQRLGDAMAAAVRAVPDIEIAVAQDFFVEDIVADPEDITLPQVNPAGVAQIYVDGFLGQGVVTYDPVGEQGFENVGEDGQFVLAGGQLRRTLDGQVGRFRLWNQALTQDQLREVRECGFPDLRKVVGGPAPHGLVASYDLDGDFTNNANQTIAARAAMEAAVSPPFDLSELEEFKLLYRGMPNDPDFEPFANATYYIDAQWGSLDVGTIAGKSLGGDGEGASAGGEFVMGGPCHHARCPASSPDTGCPLMQNQEVKFNSRESCEDFAAWNFCSLAGQSRGRPGVTGLQGCHAGGSIANSQGLPLSWRQQPPTR